MGRRAPDPALTTPRSVDTLYGTHFMPSDAHVPTDLCWCRPERVRVHRTAASPGPDHAWMHTDASQQSAPSK